MAHDPNKLVANQMMKGISGCRYAPNSTEHSRIEFLKNNLLLIQEVATKLPPRTSAAVHAVFAKAVLRYGREKPFEFANNLKEGRFNGINDPVRLLWEYLLNSKKKETGKIYKYSVTAVRAYCEGRTLTHLRPSETDIYECK